jgi:hypothetical protein
MTEHRLEPYRDANLLEFMRAAAGRLSINFEITWLRDDRSSEPEFEVYTRWYGSRERGVRLEERSGVDSKTGYVDQERTRAVLYGFDALALEVETVDGVFQGSFVNLRVEASAALEAELLELFTRTFSRG